MEGGRWKVHLSCSKHRQPLGSINRGIGPFISGAHERIQLLYGELLVVRPFRFAYCASAFLANSCRCSTDMDCILCIGTLGSGYPDLVNYPIALY